MAASLRSIPTDQAGQDRDSVKPLAMAASRFDPRYKPRLVMKA